MDQRFDGFRLRLDDDRADIVLDRPERRNALTTGSLLDLAEAARTIDGHDDVRVVVIRGEGPSFCGGMHLDTFAPGSDTSSDAGRAGREMGDAIESMSAVAIAAVHGHCVGGGLVLAAACDLRVATSDASFSIPEVDLGIPLAWGGLHRLIREIGPTRAKELVMTGRPVDAEEAGAIGLVNRVVSPGELDSAVDDLARVVAAKARFPIRATKAAANAITRSMVDLDSAVGDDELLARSLTDPEARAAAAAYLARFSDDQPRSRSSKG